MKYSYALILILAVFAKFGASSKFAYVTWNPVSKQYRLYDHIVANPVVIANFSDQIATTGWAYLHIKSSVIYPDQVQAYAAGLAEGFLTRDRMKQQWTNLLEDYCKGEESYCFKLKQFLNQNMQYMHEVIQVRRESDPFFHHVALVLEQQSGLIDGFKNVVGQPRTIMDPMDITLLNLFGDVLDFEGIFNRSTITFPLGFAPCSALIKITKNNQDLLIAHDTWYLYRSMLRILKDYDFSFHKGIRDGDIIPGKRMTFSSRPGTLPSLDDFYLISSGLAVSETSNNNYNSSLFQYVKPEGSIFTWIRSFVACRLAKTAQEWTNIYSLMNSGTYNNQWMIIDYNEFEAGEALPDNLLWISEQMPGYIRSADVTNVLRDTGYWASYNIPYFKDIFELSETQAKVDKYGDIFSYMKAPRALIFKRDEVNVHDIPSMIKLMRSNNYTDDPLSRCDCTPPYTALNAISARGDLNPKNGTYPLMYLGHGAIGGIDMKMTTSSLFTNLQMIAINGPTYDPLPPFQWSTSDFKETEIHLGHPDLWKFEPQLWPSVSFRLNANLAIPQVK